MATKTCSRCKETKPLNEEEFCLLTKSADGFDYYCKPCRKTLQQAWSDSHRDQYRETKKRNQRRLKDRVIDGYGAACTCCGETIRPFLALDHVNGGGNAQRKGRGGTQSAYRDALKRNFPPDYQLLCHNCNWGKFIFGQCPHQLETHV